MSVMVSEKATVFAAALQGLLWSLGHTLTISFAGLVFLAAYSSIPKQLHMFFEVVVGLMLAFLGISAVWKAITERIHVHYHRHGGRWHIHFHSHKASLTHDHKHRPTIVGMIHGLAGSGALTIAVIPQLNPYWFAAPFLAVFGLGTIIGMVSVSAAMGASFGATCRLAWLNLALTLSAAFIAIFLGVTAILNSSA